MVESRAWASELENAGLSRFFAQHNALWSKCESSNHEQICLFRESLRSVLAELERERSESQNLNVLQRNVFRFGLCLFQNSETRRNRSGSGGGKPDMVRLKQNHNFRDEVSS